MIAKIVTFGEIMLRLSPPLFKRFSQAREFDAVYGGGEANVAVSLANFDFNVDFITRLPHNDIGDACIQYLKQYGVNTDNIIRGGERIGIYFLEMGASSRSSKVIYDRANSALATARPELFDWDVILSDASWFHWTGITPAISENLANICLNAVKTAETNNMMVSCDMNFRSKMWNYGKNASEIMPELIKHCDILIGNEEDAEKVLGIEAPETNITSGKVDAQKYQFVVKEIMKRFPKLKSVAITLRGSLSATQNTWSGVLYNGREFIESSQYDIPYIVDRVGGGDSFVAGLIYGFLTFKEDYQKILNFAVAASCLKHTIFGDFNLVSVDEIMNIMEGNVSGRISR
jgi:2-dehydro-3-deoxygluconokinase